MTAGTGPVYAVWQDSRFSKGKRDDVLLIRSTTRGAPGRRPIKVNDTPAGAQAAFLPTVKVDSNGRVGVVYYDLRNDTNPRDGSFITTEWITFSTDGGRSFGTSQRLSPDFDHAAAAFAGGFFLGDYQGLGVQRHHVHAVLRCDARGAGKRPGRVRHLRDQGGLAA